MQLRDFSFSRLPFCPDSTSTFKSKHVNQKDHLYIANQNIFTRHQLQFLNVYQSPPAPISGLLCIALYIILASARCRRSKAAVSQENAFLVKTNGPHIHRLTKRKYGRKKRLFSLLSISDIFAIR